MTARNFPKRHRYMIAALRIGSGATCVVGGKMAWGKRTERGHMSGAEGIRASFHCLKRRLGLTRDGSSMIW